MSSKESVTKSTRKTVASVSRARGTASSRTGTAASRTGAAASRTGTRTTRGETTASKAKGAAAAAKDPTVRGMVDPWFSLVAAGLKTKDIRPVTAAPRPGAKSPPMPGFEMFKAGDKITWINSNLGFERRLPVKIVSVTKCMSSEIEAMLSKKGAAEKFTPKLTAEESLLVIKRLLRLKEGEEREFVCLEFALA